jgi:hypothetical protein
MIEVILLAVIAATLGGILASVKSGFNAPRSAHGDE